MYTKTFSDFLEKRRNSLGKKTRSKPHLIYELRNYTLIIESWSNGIKIVNAIELWRQRSQKLFNRFVAPAIFSHRMVGRASHHWYRSAMQNHPHKNTFRECWAEKTPCAISNAYDYVICGCGQQPTKNTHHMNDNFCSEFIKSSSKTIPIKINPFFFARWSQSGRSFVLDIIYCIKLESCRLLLQINSPVYH